VKLALIFPPKSGHRVKIVWTYGDDGDKMTPCQWEGDTQTPRSRSLKSSVRNFDIRSIRSRNQSPSCGSCNEPVRVGSLAGSNGSRIISKASHRSMPVPDSLSRLSANCSITYTSNGNQRSRPQQPTGTATD